MDEQNNQGNTGQQENPPQQQSEPQQQSTGGASQHKLWAIVGYIIPILFFIPLVSEKTKNNPFARFHANQQLMLLIVWAVGSLLISAYFLGVLVQLFAFVLMIIGIVNAVSGKMKKLPLVGGVSLIK